MFRKNLNDTLFILVAILILLFPLACAKAPQGAKAIFDSGEGPAVQMSATEKQEPSAETSVTATAAPAPKKTVVASKPAVTTKPVAAKKALVVTKPGIPPKEKYVGISYKIILLDESGQFDVVSKSHVFKTGDRIKMLVMTNQPGYLSIYNIGSSGATHVLFKDYVETSNLLNIPRDSNFRFVGDPGTEKVLIMLSNTPDTDSPTAVMASLTGSKDIVLEDSLETKYAVISPKQVKGSKDIILESSEGVNYGVTHASNLEEGGILTLEIMLKHE